MPTPLFDCTHSKKKTAKRQKVRKVLSSSPWEQRGVRCVKKEVWEMKKNSRTCTKQHRIKRSVIKVPNFFPLKKVCRSPLLQYFLTLLTALYHILCQYIIRQQQNYILHNYIKRQKKIYYILCLKVITFLWYRMVYYVSLQYLYFFKIHEKTREKSENHLPKASHSQTFLVFSQHPKWVIMRINRWKVRSIFFIT